eukprot:TRINITY_DN711_c0_g1_i2.p1 TRINITY_DN711_c0_g1~~TRINITY_DN711_c0_g1_i2.p1  ORF type:complete len:130 (+),score=9.90 TRINITY_DN711_c0_g1_i2:138-527(+)
MQLSFRVNEDCIPNSYSFSQLQLITIFEIISALHQKFFSFVHFCSQECRTTGIWMVQNHQLFMSVLYCFVITAFSNSQNQACFSLPVSYTHLTLPTICSVQISVVAVSLKKKKKQNTQITRIYVNELKE